MKIYVQKKPRGGPEDLWRTVFRIRKGNRGVKAARIIADKLRKDDHRFVVRMKIFHPVFSKTGWRVTHEQQVSFARTCVITRDATREVHAAFKAEMSERRTIL